MRVIVRMIVAMLVRVDVARAPLPCPDISLRRRPRPMPARGGRDHSCGAPGSGAVLLPLVGEEAVDGGDGERVRRADAQRGTARQVGDGVVGSPRAVPA